jgi:dihydrofolate reductase
MSKLIMWNLITLDGYFEGENPWDLEKWHTAVWGDELEQLSIEQLKSCSALLFGRKTYEGMAAYWTKAEGTAEDEVAGYMNSIPKFVFSRTLAKAEWNNTTLVKDHIADGINRLKKRSGKDLFVFGSADFSSTLTELGLFDEYRLCIVPVILGKGNPLFKADSVHRDMTLIETKQLKSGGVIVRYQPKFINTSK